jgi:hypothetical protein
MPCSFIQGWMTDNNITGSPVFAGNDDINNAYGTTGGMPTIIVLGGTDHKILYWNKGFTSRDSKAITTAIDKILNAQSSVSNVKPTESISAFPNPAASIVSMNVNCVTDGNREITLYNVKGVKLLSLFNGNMASGEHALNFSTKTLSAGKYFIHVTTEGKTSIVPLTVVH